MKKLVCLWSLMCCLLHVSMADQLAWITEAQAIKATEFLKTQKHLMLYCACCSLDDPK